MVWQMYVTHTHKKKPQDRTHGSLCRFFKPQSKLQKL